MRLCYKVESPESELHFYNSIQEAHPFFRSIKDTLSFKVVLLLEKELEHSWGHSIQKLLEQEGIQVLPFSLPGGESCKSRKAKELIEDFLLTHQIGKDSCLVCLGGGALLDLGGFVASTYARGLPLAFIPTTLLSMVDASVGGKTAINAHQIKNCIGTFYPARHILLTPQLLSTLPDNALEDAFPEICKYGLIQEPLLFSLLKQNEPLWRAKDISFIQTLILHSLHVKKKVTEKDFQEKGLRRILNFGHTIAHAIEGFFASSQIYSHGEAVAIGLCIESHLSYQLGYLSSENLNDILNLLQQYNWPKIKTSFSFENLFPFFSLDKKSNHSKARFVLLSHIGSCVPFEEEYCYSPSLTQIKKSIHWFCSTFMT